MIYILNAYTDYSSELPAMSHSSCTLKLWRVPVTRFEIPCAGLHD